MKRLQKSVYLSASFVMISFLVFTTFIPAASAGTCPENRWVPVPKMDYYVPAYPEENTTYWVFDFKTYKNMRLEIKGEFPHARYMNLVLYDFNSGEMAVGENYVLEDRDIVADPGSYNPFEADVERNKKGIGRNYTVYVVREDNDRGDQFGPNGKLKDNTLVIPSDLEVAAVFLRVYMPDNEDDAKGDVELPDISTFYLDENGPVPSPCPNQQLALLPDKLKEITRDIFVPEERLDDLSDEDKAVVEKYENTVLSYNPGEGWGLYPNGDNPYLVAPLYHRPAKVVTVKFKAPTFTPTRTNPSKKVKESDEVRYFSVCMGGYKMTNTSDCLSDEELKVDVDGYVHVAIVPNFIDKTKYAFDKVWNVFKWGQHQSPALLFRQIGVNPKFYENSFWNTKDAFNVDTMQEFVDSNAKNTIGEYAPTGVYCEFDEFDKNRCRDIKPVE